MPQKPRFLRKMMGFDGGVRVPASATLRCTRKNLVAIAARFFPAVKFKLLYNESFVLRNGRTSCPLKKALIMLFRDEMRERISQARTVTERKVNRTLRETGVRFIFLCHACGTSYGVKGALFFYIQR